MRLRTPLARLRRNYSPAVAALPPASGYPAYWPWAGCRPGFSELTRVLLARLGYGAAASTRCPGTRPEGRATYVSETLFWWFDSIQRFSGSAICTYAKRPRSPVTSIHCSGYSYGYTSDQPTEVPRTSLWMLGFWLHAG